MCHNRQIHGQAVEQDAQVVWPCMCFYTQKYPTPLAFLLYNVFIHCLLAHMFYILYTHSRPIHMPDIKKILKLHKNNKSNRKVAIKHWTTRSTIMHTMNISFVSCSNMLRTLYTYRSLS